MTPHNKVEISGTQQQQQKTKTNFCSHDRLGWDVFRSGISSCLQDYRLGVCDLNPGRNKRFFTSCTSSGAHQASYSMVSRGPFPGDYAAVV